MKKVSIFGISFLSALAFAMVMFFNSCDSDACKDVNCGSNGACVDGTCVCDAGYEGTNCETEIRTKYLGSYSLTGTDNFGYTYTNLPATIATSSVDVTKMIFTLSGSFSFPLTENGSTGFTIDQTSSGGFTYTGNGSINGSTLTITINEADNVMGATTIYNFQGPKQ